MGYYYFYMIISIFGTQINSGSLQTDTENFVSGSPNSQIRDNSKNKFSELSNTFF